MSRTIPYDPSIKLMISLGHIFGFALYYGSTMVGTEIPWARDVVISTGILLVGRELYKGGWAWLTRTDGLATIFKVILISLALAFPSLQTMLLSVVVLLGMLSTHLPDALRKRAWFGNRRVQKANA